MSVHTYRRQDREFPYRREHERSIEAKAETGRMPKGLPELLHWYAKAWDSETPARLHKGEVWRDFGEHASGGSALGSPAWSDPFRRYLENSPSETDADGYFVRPIHAALSRMTREGKPLTARTLFAVAQCGFDWRGVADRGHWPHEMFRIYLSEALRMLWMGHTERTVLAA